MVSELVPFRLLWLEQSWAFKVHKTPRSFQSYSVLASTWASYIKWSSQTGKTTSWPMVSQLAPFTFIYELVAKAEPAFLQLGENAQLRSVLEDVRFINKSARPADCRFWLEAHCIYLIHLCLPYCNVTQPIGRPVAKRQLRHFRSSSLQVGIHQANIKSLSLSMLPFEINVIMIFF